MPEQDIDRDRSLVPWLIGNRLRGALSRRRMTQRQLAEATGIPQATIATYLSGRVAMPVPALLAISRALSADPGWLLAGAELRLDQAALGYAALRAGRRTNVFDTSTPEAERALNEALSVIAVEYGAACNFVWTGSTDEDNGEGTFVIDLAGEQKKD